MRLSALSIERPVLAAVATLLLMLFGLLSYSRLPVREYPDTTFPIVSVMTVYPSADAQLVETDITSVLEDALSGVEGLRTLRSTSREGLSTIGLEFSLMRNLDAAANDVRDRVTRVQYLLPQGIEAPLVMKEDSDSDGIMWLALISDRHTELEMTDFAERQLKDRLAPLPGVSSVMLDGGRRYAMRIWLDPDRLASRLLTVQDVEDALRTQNVSMPTGRIESTQREFSVRMGGGLEKAAQFNQLILAYRDGYPVRLQDVGAAEIGPEDDRKLVRVNGKPAIGLGIMKQSKANTLEAARAVKRTIPAMEALLPEGMQLVTAFDSSIYIERSLHEVYEAVGLSVLLVVLVVFLFLRSARATLIPAVAIPGSILGTFVIMQMTGSSINTITLLGFVLAIGLVVDDAIVVVENVYRRIERGLSPTQAAIEGSREIGFAVISTTLTLAAVFFPIIFLPGIVGRLFAELGIAVAGSVLLSGFIALTLTPAMCARLLGKTAGTASPSRGSALDPSAWLRWLTQRYRLALKVALERPAIILGGAVLSLIVSAALMWGLPSELAPLEDTGWFAVHVSAPEGSTLDYTDRYARETENATARIPEMDSYYTVVARGWRPTLVNRAVTWVTLKDWSDRNRVQQEIVDDVQPALSAIPGATVFALNPPPFNQEDSKTPVQLVIRGPSYEVLDKIVTQIRHDLTGNQEVVNVESDLDLNKPELRVEINRDKAADLGIPKIALPLLARDVRHSDRDDRQDVGSVPRREKGLPVHARRQRVSRHHANAAPSTRHSIGYRPTARPWDPGGFDSLEQSRHAAGNRGPETAEPLRKTEGRHDQRGSGGRFDAQPVHRITRTDDPQAPASRRNHQLCGRDERAQGVVGQSASHVSPGPARRLPHPGRAVRKLPPPDHRPRLGSPGAGRRAVGAAAVPRHLEHL